MTTFLLKILRWENWSNLIYILKWWFFYLIATQDDSRLNNVPSTFPTSRIPPAMSLPVQRPPPAITTTSTANGHTTSHPSVTKSMSFAGVTTTTLTNGSSKRTMDDIIRQVTSIVKGSHFNDVTHSIGLIDSFGLKVFTPLCLNIYGHFTLQSQFSNYY